MMQKKFEEIDSDVDTWGAHWKNKFEEHGTIVAECFIYTEGLTSVSIDPRDFFRICKTTGQTVIFLHRLESDIDALISRTMETKTDESGEDLAKLNKLFRNECSQVICQAKAQCPFHYDAEFFVWHQGGAIKTGVRSLAYDRLVTALEEFCENVEARREVEENIQHQAVLREMELIADELKLDEVFLGIRGKRKRCVYVEQKYGPRFGKAVFFRRPDPSSEMMNSDIVALVERVSDEMALWQK